MFRFKIEQKIFPAARRLLGFNTDDIVSNWKALKSVKFQTEEVMYKPYTLMEFKMKRPLDQNMAALVDTENIYRKLQLDHMFMMNFAHPIPDPSPALLMKVS